MLTRYTSLLKIGTRARGFFLLLLSHYLDGVFSITALRRNNECFVVYYLWLVALADYGVTSNLATFYIFGIFIVLGFFLHFLSPYFVSNILYSNIQTNT